jgi:homoserine O-succinyltransferase/O-acetyltransferase
VVKYDKQMAKKMLKVALLDMYNGEDNRGMPMLRSILSRYSNTTEFKTYDVRLHHEVPAVADADIFIFSGGPGDPLESDQPWVEPFYALIQDLYDYNAAAREQDNPRKHCFFICHSFQIACHVFGLGQVTERQQMSFGTYPVHKTFEGKQEAFFTGLPDPFYIADFRRYQVVQPNKSRIHQLGCSILCLEKLRPHVHYERAIMAMRFSPEMFGTQFHPEANPDGMLVHFQNPDRRATIIEQHGAARYERMIRDLSNPLKIERTFETIIPSFLEMAIVALSRTELEPA